MTRVAARLLLAVALLLAGGLAWTAGGIERQSAEALRLVASLRFAEAIEAYDELERSVGLAASVPLYGDARLAEARARRAVARYWLADYGALGVGPGDGDQDEAVDAEVLLSAANAAYRAAGAGAVDQRVLEAYARVLEGSPGHADAAFNYELVARRRADTRKDDAGGPGQAPTIHGVPGAPPKGADMGQFKVVIPKRGEERQEDPEAGAGRTRTRRG